MAKKSNFAGELAAISATVEKDVGRVVSLLREEPRGVGDDAEPTRSPESKVSQQSAGAPHDEVDAHSRPVPGTRVKYMNDGQVVLENVTTRLTRETNQLLTEAALRQKLAKRKPDTRQDITEEAVRDWLTRLGYAGKPAS